MIKIQELLFEEMRIMRVKGMNISKLRATFWQTRCACAENGPDLQTQ